VKTVQLVHRERGTLVLEIPPDCGVAPSPPQKVARVQRSINKTLAGDFVEDALGPVKTVSFAGAITLFAKGSEHSVSEPLPLCVLNAESVKNALRLQKISVRYGEE